MCTKKQLVHLKCGISIICPDGHLKIFDIWKPMPQNSQPYDSIVIQSKDHKKFVVSTIDIHKSKKPPWIAIAGGPLAKPNDKHLLQMIGEMSTAERWFFLYVASKMDHSSNTAQISNAELTKSQINAKSRAYKALHKKGLLKRVKREYYMVNPNIIIPLGRGDNDRDIFLELTKKWDSI